MSSIMSSLIGFLKRLISFPDNEGLSGGQDQTIVIVIPIVVILVVLILITVVIGIVVGMFISLLLFSVKLDHIFNNWNRLQNT